MADREAEERRRRQRAKNWALVAVLVAFVALVYAVSIVRMSGWQYQSLLTGLPYPLVSHFLFGVAGAIVGAGFLHLSGQRGKRISG